MFALIMRGISLGFAAGVLPGPFQSYLINATLRLGWRRSVTIVFSPLIVDIPVIIVVVFVLGRLPEGFIRGIQILGGLFLLWIARETWLALRADAIPASEHPGDAPTSRVLARGLVMNALSPGPYLFWSTVNGPLLLQALSQSLLHAVGFLTAFYGTFLGILAATVFLFDRVRFINPRVSRLILWVTIAMLCFFAITLIVGLNL